MDFTPKELLLDLPQRANWNEGNFGECKLVGCKRVYSGDFSEIWRGEFDCGLRNMKVALKVARFPAGRRAPDSESAAKEFQVLQHIYDILSSHAMLSVPKPIALYREKNAFVMETIDGRTLFDAFSRLNFLSERAYRKLGESVELVGKWLSTFQAGDILDNAFVTMENAHEVDIDHLGKLACEGGMPPSLARRAVEVGKSLLDTWTPAEPVNTHGDFVPWNVVINDENVIVLDFTHYRLSDPENDLSLMYCTLNGLATAWRIRGKIDWFRRRFLKGYGTPAVPVRWMFWRIKSLLYLFCWFRMNKGSWRARRKNDRVKKLYEADIQGVLSEAEALME